jgi:hypothetical protein
MFGCAPFLEYLVVIAPKAIPESRLLHLVSIDRRNYSAGFYSISLIGVPKCRRKRDQTLPVLGHEEHSVAIPMRTVIGLWLAARALIAAQRKGRRARGDQLIQS